MSGGGGMRKSSKSVRPLGAVRQPAQMTDRVGHIPAFNYKSIHHDYELQGSAMQVPPPKEEPEREVRTPAKPQISVRSGKSDSDSSTKSQKEEISADKKELQDAKTKIKELRQQVSSLEKEIEELRGQLAQRDATIEQMRNAQAALEEKYKQMYEREVTEHGGTREILDKARMQITHLENQISSLHKEHQEKLDQAQIEFKGRLADTVAQKDKEIAERDIKLSRLKQQMADSLKGNSWERQQQLEELTKELGRIQDEADTLRIKLRQYKANKTCTNCQDLASKLERAVISIKEKDSSIKDLNSLCSKFETQLKKQDEIMKLFAEKKGHKVTNFPK